MDSGPIRNGIQMHICSSFGSGLETPSPAINCVCAQLTEQGRTITLTTTPARKASEVGLVQFTSALCGPELLVY